MLYDEHDVLADLRSRPELTVEAASMCERAVADQARHALDVVVELRRATT